MSKKYVYLFSEGNKDMRDLLGGKGANLAEMTNAGLPVPAGFTVTTEACTRYYDDGGEIALDIQNEIFEYMKKIEAETGKSFGDKENPLLVSVRSGARASMPGMMDTILNLGLNDDVVQGLAKRTNNPRFAYDSYRRFIQMFGDVVMSHPFEEYEALLEAMKEDRGVDEDTELGDDDMIELVKQYKALYQEKQGEAFPDDPSTQLIEAVRAVFRSWDNPRANSYRRMHQIPYEWGTAVSVQMMVFGNSGDESGTGVAFTRNPATGENEFFGEYLINAQGEDVVAGIRTPSPISELKEQMPEVYEAFFDIAERLENHYKDMQDLEFTIEDKKLYMLQTRSGKRTAAAAIKIAVDMVNEGTITKEEAILRVDPNQLDSLLHPQFDPDALKKAQPIGKALAASPGAANGHIVFTADDARDWHKDGKKVILVRVETSPEDIEGMAVASGILTTRGGMTSHAAVVARGMGICCVSAFDEAIVDYENKQVTVGDKVYKEGHVFSLDGSTGAIYDKELPTVEATILGDFELFMEWVDDVRQLGVFANADNPRDAQHGVDYGCEGIGLCRTEHMFFDTNRIKLMREMIVAPSVKAREKALAQLLPYQQNDFEGIFEVMAGKPVVIRFLDPPLHEFLPTEEGDIVEIAKEIDLTTDELRAIITALHEFNPMMGHRGVRLTISYPEIARMQTTAIIKAAIAVTKKTGEAVEPQIMIPLVGDVNELTYVKEHVIDTAETLIKDSGIDVKYEVGTMIEIPRATLLADEIAKEADFFSFGTNDLTQLTFGFSRDDATKFLDYYYDSRIYEADPFAHLDQEGVGMLVERAVDLGLKGNPDLHLGICGEHGGDPSSIEFFHNVGLDYVSCSPFRVPIARLAAAQSALKNPR